MIVAGNYESSSHYKPLEVATLPDEIDEMLQLLAHF